MRVEYFFSIIKFSWPFLLMGWLLYSSNKSEHDAKIESQKKLAPYNNEINRYLKKGSVSKSRISAKGNVIFVNQKTRTVDKFSDYMVSPNNQPKTPAEVDSVVLHDCEYVQVASYENGSRAMQHVCDFTVIDVATGTWSNWGGFKGTMPPDEIKRKRGSTSDEEGGPAIYSFFNAGGLVTRGTASQ